MFFHDTSVDSHRNCFVSSGSVSVASIISTRKLDVPLPLVFCVDHNLALLG